jgi:hypothetical protein
LLSTRHHAPRARRMTVRWGRAPTAPNS